MLNRFWRGKSVFLLDGALIAAAILLALRYQPQSVADYERLCREATDQKKKEEIALAAVDFLRRQPVPDSIAHQIDRAVAEENLYQPIPPSFFKIPPVMTDSLVGIYDDFLTEYLPKLYWRRRHLPDSVRSENFTTVRKIAALIDSSLNYSYWLPLMNFLDRADSESWHRWRAATRAAALSRTAYTQSQFERAKFLALAGFHNSDTIPNRRLYLDLCIRLQNAIAEGPESVFNIGFALADWVTRESRRAGYFLRLVSAEYNCGNQFYQLGRYDEALERLKIVLQLAQRWRHFPSRHMQWYGTEAMERIAAVAYELGDYTTIRYCLDQYGKLAGTTRQRTLFLINSGRAARLIGDLQTAENEFQKAVIYGQGDETKNREADPANVWYAYLELGDIYLEYQLPERALHFFQKAKNFVAKDKSFLNAERLSRYWLLLAKALIAKGEFASAQKALEDAKKQPVDSPWLRVKGILRAAEIHADLGQMPEAAAVLAQAREICRSYGMTISEIEATLKQAALFFKTQKNFPPANIPPVELENLIAQITKSGEKQQLVHSLALAVEAACQAGQFDQARQYADWILRETETLSRLYDQEQRLIFFQHSIYADVKTAIGLDLRRRATDSAFIKLDYIKSRALRRRLHGLQMPETASSPLPFVDIKKLQKQLQPEEAIVNYMVADDTLYAFILTAAELQIIPSATTRRDLQKLVQEYFAELMPAHSGNAEYDEEQREKSFARVLQLSHQLYTKIIKKIVEPRAQLKRLFIVPDEFLYLLPFNTLACRNDLPADFLIEHQAVMYIPAASFLLGEKEFFPPEISPTSLLASIDPAMYGAAKLSERLHGLKNINAIVKTQWESKAELKSCLADQYRTLFFYAHAKANWEDPWLSYIQFPLQGAKQNGALAYADIDSINWRNAALVILAGCETAGNRVYGGAGLSGLLRGFLGAGAGQVLSTFWTVDAGQVTPQMESFLEIWNRTGDAVLALQKTQQTAITQLRKDPYIKYPHPRYWGAYNLTGTKSTIAEISGPYAERQTQ